MKEEIRSRFTALTVSVYLACGLLFFTNIGCLDRHHSDNDKVKLKYPQAPKQTGELARINGNIGGLIGSGLNLKAGSEELAISSNGAFQFSLSYNPKDVPELKVDRHPTNPTQECSVTSPSVSESITALGNTSDNAYQVDCRCPVGAFRISGQLSGLNGGELTLANNSDTFTLTQDGGFTLNKEYANCSSYDLKVEQAPAGRACSVTVPGQNIPAGRIDGKAVPLDIVCIDDSVSYDLNVTVSGLDLAGPGSLTIQGPSGEIDVNSDGHYLLQGNLQNGAAYGVSFSHNYSDLGCEIQGGDGFIQQGDRTARIHCGPEVCRLYANQSSLVTTDGSFNESCGLGTSQSQFVHTCTLESGGDIVATTNRYYNNQNDFIDEAPLGDFLPGSGKARFIEEFGPDNSTNQDGDSLTRAFFIGGRLDRIVANSIVEAGEWRSATMTIQYSDYDSHERPQSAVATADIDTVGGCRDVNVSINYGLSPLSENYSATGGESYGQAAEENPCPKVRNGLFRQEEYDSYGNLLYGNYLDANETDPVAQTEDRSITDTSSICYANITTSPVYYIEVAVSGLDGSLVVQNDNRNDYYIFSDGNYTLPSEVFTGASYNLSLAQSPAGQNCTLNGESGTVGTSNVGTSISCSTSGSGGTTLAADVVGLQNAVGLDGSAPLLLTANDITLLAATGNGSFYFSGSFNENENYNVSLTGQPEAHECNLTGAVGIIAAGSNTVQVTCSYNGPGLITVSGTAAGISEPVKLLLNGSEELTVTANGAFQFNTQISSANEYAASLQQPTNNRCHLANASGLASEATNLNLVCLPPAPATALELQVIDFDVSSSPAGVTSEFTFDHKALVDTGQSTIDGRDLALYYAPAGSFSLQVNGTSSLKTMAQGLPASFSVELWFRTDSTNGGVLTGFDGESNKKLRLYLSANGAIYAGWQNESGDITTINSFQGYNDNLWHHVSLTFHQDIGFGLYVDGARTAGLAGIDANELATTGHWSVSRAALTDWPESATNSDGQFSGLIDELRLSSVVRYQTDFSPSTEEFIPDEFTLGLYHFGERTGVLLDFSGKSNKLTASDASGFDWVAQSPLPVSPRRITFNKAPGSSYYNETTTIRFKQQAAINDGFAQGRYLFYSGTSPVADFNLPGNVYQFYSGPTSSSTPGNGLWQNGDQPSVELLPVETGQSMLLTAAGNDSDQIELTTTYGSFITGSGYSGAPGYNYNWFVSLFDLPTDVDITLGTIDDAGRTDFNFEHGSGWSMDGPGETDSLTSAPPSDHFELHLNQTAPTLGQTDFTLNYRPQNGTTSNLLTGTQPTSGDSSFILATENQNDTEVSLTFQQIRLSAQGAEGETNTTIGASGPPAAYTDLQSDLADLTWANIRDSNTFDYDVKLPLNLYAVGAAGSSLAWQSNLTATITNDGNVIQPTQSQGTATVEITANLTNNGFSAERTFTLTVPELAAVPVSATVNGLIGQAFTLELTSDSPHRAEVVQHQNLNGPGTEITFTEAINENDSYAMLVTNQPSNPGQVCSVTNGTGNAGVDAIVADVDCVCPAGSYRLGGTVAGLNGGTLSIEDNNGTPLDITSNGAFLFSGNYDNCGAFEISITNVPDGIACGIENSTGFVDGADAIGTTIQCESTTITYAVGVSVYGLTSGDLELVMQSTAASINENHVVSTDGYLAFPAELNNGADYQVSITSEPVGVDCTVTPGSGVIANSGAIVNVDCAQQVCRDYATTSDVATSQGENWTNTCSLNTPGSEVHYSCRNEGDLAVAGDTNVVYNSMGAYVNEWPDNPGFIPAYGFDYSDEAPDSSDRAPIHVDAQYSNGRMIRQVTRTQVDVSGWIDFTVTMNYDQFDEYDRPTAGSAVAATDTQGGCRNLNVAVVYDDSTYTLTRSAAGGECFGAACGAPNICASVRNAIYEELVYTPAGIQTVRRYKDASGTDESTTFTQTTSNITSAEICYTPEPTRIDYSISVAISGLSSSVVLQNRSHDELTISQNGLAVFAVRIPAGEPYDITVASQPFGQECSLDTPNGMVVDTDIVVTASCEDVAVGPGIYSVNMDITGLNGSLELSDGDGQIYSVNISGRFTFPTPYTTGDSYDIILQSVPAGQDCTLTGAQGTVATTDVIGQIDCIDIGPPTYSIGGTVTGLASSLILSNTISGETLNVVRGDFTFMDRQLAATDYNVIITTPAPDQECILTGGQGTVADEDITTIVISCQETPSASSSHAIELAITAADYLPAGYSIPITIDHEAMVTAGHSESDGRDVRVVWHASSGSALQLDGNDDQYIYSVQRYDNPTTFTIELWVQTNSGYGGHLLGFGDSIDGQSTNKGRVLYMANNGRIYFGIHRSSARVIHSDVRYNDGAWHHVAATLDPSGGMKLYIDGSLVDENNSESTARDMTGFWRVGGENLLPVMYGNYELAPISHTIDGNIDEVRVSDVVRYDSDFEVRSTEFIPDENTVWLLHFDEKDGRSLIDSSHRGNHAILRTDAADFSTDSPLTTPTRELHRVVDYISDWNQSNTTLWLKLQNPIPNGTTAQAGEYVLYYGLESAGPAPQVGNQVFALYDDFSDGVIDPSWQVNLGGGSAQEQNGALTLSLPNSIDGNWPGGVRFFKPAPFFASDYQPGLAIDSLLTTFTTTSGGLAGIAESEGDTELNALFAYYNTEPGLSIEDEFGSTGFTAQSVEPVYLRLKRDTAGANWQMHSSSTGIDYASVGSLPADNDPGNIGLFAGNRGALPAVTAEYDFIRARLYTENEPLISAGSTGLVADRRNLLEDMAAVDFILISGDNDYPTAVKTELFFVDEGPIHGSAISWASNKPHIVDGDGIVDRSSVTRRPSETVLLTATFSYLGFTRKKEFKLHVLADPISDATTGTDHSCVLNKDGELYCFGLNTLGRLGYGHTTSTYSKTPGADGPVPLDEKVIQVGAGDQFTCALLENAAVRCWGYNIYGQLGIGSTTIIGDTEPVLDAPEVNLPGDATQISVGWWHACALLYDGSFTCWGRGAFGRLGYGSSQNVGDNSSEIELQAIRLSEPVTQISAGREHTCALVESGRVLCWGYNDFGQLGIGSTIEIGDNEPITEEPFLDFGEPVDQISAGGYHSCALLAGDVVCWGLNTDGQLGYGDLTTRGNTQPATTQQKVPTGVTIASVTAGERSTCAITDDQEVYCWGENFYGQLGYGINSDIGDDEPIHIFRPLVFPPAAYSVSIHTGHSCAASKDDRFYCWGQNNFGEAGQGNPILYIGDNEQLSSFSAINLTDDGTGSYSIGGYSESITGTLTLAIDYGSGVELHPLDTNGPFELTGPSLNSGTSYLVWIDTNPSGLDCDLQNGSGTIAKGPITNITISCEELLP